MSLTIKETTSKAHHKQNPTPKQYEQPQPPPLPPANDMRKVKPNHQTRVTFSGRGKCTPQGPRDVLSAKDVTCRIVIFLLKHYNID